MIILSQILVGLVALLHIYFFVLESFLWTHPYGLKTFGRTLQEAQESAVLAANQGLYNLFLSAGLVASFFFKSPEISYTFQLFFMGCVSLAGIYGALTTGPKAGPRIFCIQALPALLGFLLLCLS